LAVEEGFVHPDHRSLVLTNEHPNALLDEMERYAPPRTKKWVSPRKL
jgi:predicted Rossmann-fold nucleotide-binding protein